MILIDIDLPIDCRHCRFSAKIGNEYKCIVMDENMHPSWVEKSLENPVRPSSCPLRQVNEIENACNTESL